VFVVEIYTPEKRVFKGEVKHMTAPGKKGSFGILTGHAPLLSSLNPGELKIDMVDGACKILSVPNGGFLEVDNNHVIVLADKLETKTA